MVPLAQMKKKRLTPLRVIRGVYNRLRVYGQGIVSTPIKLWYANSAGLRNNFGEKRNLKRLQNDFLLQGEQISAQQSALLSAQLLQHDGYYTLPAYFDRETLLKLQQDVAQKMENPELSISSPNGATQFLLDPLKNVPALEMLLRDEICAIITSYYKCAFRVESVRVWRNHHVPNIDTEKDDKFSNTFHHDNCPVMGLRVFVLLSDGVTRETGALRFHDKTTSKNIIRRLGYFHREKLTKSMRQRLLNPSTLSFFEGNLGDVCICNTQECLHAASVPKLGTYRDMLQFEIYPTAGPIQAADVLLAKVPADKALLAMRG
ncbi:hypothetical protein [Legionella maioricensis]|uniref:Uncharacterized protein n=1 Tax=Legionella maioricensis TaxID=2896528 RepID=A0A9X2CZI8_9GAMM|nr:hypothetical protein [Legionella maioricensis]MCL9683564.1 hypothetical protein [Legionella maioricensis]MCL9686863.1 hypothetical protein [Legionella maioricensis]